MANVIDDDLRDLRASSRAQLRDHVDPDALWSSFARSGLATMLAGEDFGDADLQALSTVAHEVGYALSAAPFTASAVGAGRVVAALHRSPAVDRLRADLESGAVAVLAVPYMAEFTDADRHSDVASSGEGPSLAVTGQVTSVMSASDADVFLVPTERSGTPLLVAVQRGHAVRVVAEPVVDQTRRLASIILEEAPAICIAEGAQVWDLVSQGLMAETLSVSAEMVGAAQAALDEVVAFAGQRRTFGQALGTYQAFRHRCVDRLVDIEAARVLVAEAGSLMQVTELTPPAGVGSAIDVALVLAKTAAGDALHAMAEESILLRGAFGFTWEGGGHRFMRRWLTDTNYRGRPDQLSHILDEAVAASAVHARAEDDEFTRQAQEWIAANAPAFADPTDATGYFPELTADQIGERLDRSKAWERCKKGAGWAGIAVPVEYGGRGGSAADAARFTQLEHRQPLPHVQFEVTSGVVMPSLLRWADEEQCRRHIPAILSGDELWCQLTSEPDAGSDLGMLATRATRIEGGWEINGRKIWISGAQFASFGLLLARTDPNVPKHQGISAFIMPMDAQGIDVQPIRQASGSEHFCEVSLDHVILPESALVGQPGDGWKIIVAALAFERLTLSGSGIPFDSIFELSREVGSRRGAQQDAGLRRLMRTMRSLEALTRQSLARADAGTPPGAETSINKLLTGRAAHQSAQLVELMLGGELAQRTEWAQYVLGSVGLRIGGGTEEIQRDVLADRMLKLPAAPRGDRTKAWSQLVRT